MKVAVIGTGTMGSAIERRFSGEHEVRGFGREDDKLAVDEADVVVLAVKPKSLAEAADQLWLDGQDSRRRRNNQLFISVIAGKTLGELCLRLGSENVVRTMPNLALAQGQSLTAWLPAKGADAERAESIIGTWGPTLRLQDETQFDAFTALAGSGPAYFFELARVVKMAGQQHGFSAEQAQLIAAQTFLGAASVVDIHTDFAAKVQSVMSEGGTTAAAFGVFAEEGFADVVYHGVDAAAVRSRELGVK